MKAPLERDVLAACLQLLRLRGCVALRINSGAITTVHQGKRRYVRFNAGYEGVSDILFLAPGGRFGAVECKAPGKKATPAQLAFIEMIRAKGGVGLVVSDVRELDECLGELLP